MRLAAGWCILLFTAAASPAPSPSPAAEVTSLRWVEDSPRSRLEITTSQPVVIRWEAPEHAVSGSWGFVMVGATVPERLRRTIVTDDLGVEASRIEIRQAPSGVQVVCTIPDDISDYGVNKVRVKDRVVEVDFHPLPPGKAGQNFFPLWTFTGRKVSLVAVDATPSQLLRLLGANAKLTAATPDDGGVRLHLRRDDLPWDRIESEVAHVAGWGLHRDHSDQYFGCEPDLPGDCMPPAEESLGSDGLHVVAVVWGLTSGPRAMLASSNGSGVVAVGSPVGEHGRVTRISESEVALSDRDEAGNPREILLSIHTAAPR